MVSQAEEAMVSGLLLSLVKGLCGEVMMLQKLGFSGSQRRQTDTFICHDAREAIH